MHISILIKLNSCVKFSLVLCVEVACVAINIRRRGGRMHYAHAIALWQTTTTTTTINIHVYTIPSMQSERENHTDSSDERKRSNNRKKNNKTKIEISFYMQFSSSQIWFIWTTATNGEEKIEIKVKWMRVYIIHALLSRFIRKMNELRRAAWQLN